MQITFVIKFNISLLQIIGLCGYKKRKKKRQIKLKFKSKPIQQLFNLPPQNLETSEQKKLLKTVFICQKSSFTAPRFSTCKVSQHVKYKPYNTLESKRVPKSTVKITLPSFGNVEGMKKKKHQREK